MGSISQANMEVEMAESAWDKTRRTNMVNLLADVGAAGGIAVMPMCQVRDAACWDKLRDRVLTDIANLLSHHGIGEPAPTLVDGFIRKTFTAMIEGIREPAISAGPDQRRTLRRRDRRFRANHRTRRSVRLHLLQGHCENVRSLLPRL